MDDLSKITADIERQQERTGRAITDLLDRYAERVAKRTGEDVEDVKAAMHGKAVKIMRKFADV